MTTDSASLRVLAVEDNPADTRLLRIYAAERGGPLPLELELVETLRAGLDRLAAARFDAVLLDLGLPDCRGFETFSKMAAEARIPIIVATGHEDHDLAARCLAAGAEDFLVKDRMNSVLSWVVHNAVKRHAARAKLKRLNAIVGALSEVNKLIVRQRHPAELLARCATVLARALDCRATITCGALEGMMEGGDLTLSAGAAPTTEDCPALVLPLTHRGREFGTLTLRDATRLEDDATRPEDEERGLLEQLATDIAYGLHDVEQDAKRRADEQARELLEKELREARRLEAVGQLAGGVAHEFNNLLTIITSYADILGEGLPAGHALGANIEQINVAVERAAGLTRQLLAFGRQQILRPTTLDLNEVLENLEPLLRQLLDESIEVELRCGDELPPIEADPGQIEQVLLNLVLNARDAMPEGGSLVIETAPLALDEQTPHRPPGLPAGRYATLSVRDSGCGMPDELRERIFEPFFTTKAQGQGTGLGLASVTGSCARAAATSRSRALPVRAASCAC